MRQLTALDYQSRFPAWSSAYRCTVPSIKIGAVLRSAQQKEQTFERIKALAFYVIRAYTLIGGKTHGKPQPNEIQASYQRND